MICVSCNLDVATAYACVCGKIQCGTCSAMGCCGFSPARVDHVRVEGDVLTPENDEYDEDGVSIEEPTPLVQVDEIEVDGDPPPSDHFGEWQDTGGSE